jgi:ubiquinone/menaquinone biosynthesis C-methylase UbiE
MPHRFEAKGDFVDRLGGKERRTAIPPDEIIDRMAISKDGALLDLGAGIGYFSIPLSPLVKEIVSVDVESKMLAILSSEAKKQKRSNLSPVLADVLSVPVMDESFDNVLLAFIYHELAMPALLLEECARVLKPGGRLTVVEFQKTKTDFGPPVEERKAPQHVERRAEKRFRVLEHYSEKVYYQLEFRKK